MCFYNTYKEVLVKETKNHRFTALSNMIFIGVSIVITVVDSTEYLYIQEGWTMLLLSSHEDVSGALYATDSFEAKDNLMYVS